jgi:hypothetical protein
MMLSASNVAMASPRRGWYESITVGTRPQGRTSDHEPSVAGYFSPSLVQRVRYLSSVAHTASPILCPDGESGDHHPCERVGRGAPIVPPRIRG